MICSMCVILKPEVCVEGDVMLVNGSSQSEGTVMVCYNSTYSTICDHSWDELDASVVCNQLGLSNGCKYHVTVSLVVECY